MADTVVAVVVPQEHPALAYVPTIPGYKLLVGNELDKFLAFPEIGDVQALVWIAPGSVEVMEELVTRYPAISWVHSFSAGVDHIGPFITKCLLDKPIALTNGRGAFSNSLAEYVMAAALHYNKQFVRCQENKRQKKWDKFVMPVLEGRTMGFVGFGNIAQATAKIAKHAFGMKILALRRNTGKGDDDGLADVTYGFDNKLELFKQADYVVCVLPGTPETAGFVGAAEFAAMKEAGVFISIGRGIAVDEDALLQALHSGSIAGAALDVFKTEPLPPEHPLWDAPNLLMTAHNADYTEDYFQLGWDVFCKNAATFQGGKGVDAMATPVDKTAGY